MSDDPVAAYLAELGAALRRHRLRRRRAQAILEECRFHLEAAAAELVARGSDPLAARREAVRRFGAPAPLVAEWRRAEGARAPSRWRWTAATTLGILAGIGLGLPAGRWVDARLDMALILPAVGGVIGSVLGVGQALALGGRRVVRWRWTVASALGLAAGLTLGTLVLKGLGLLAGSPVPEALALAILGASIGLALALAQWHLGRPALAGPTRWVASHGLGSALGLLAGGLVAGPALGGIETAGGVTLAVVVGALGTGLAGSLVVDQLASSS